MKLLSGDLVGAFPIVRLVVGLLAVSSTRQTICSHAVRLSLIFFEFSNRTRWVSEMAKRTKKQHIVPRFYLAKFSDESGYVWTYSAKGEPLGRKPEATAVETNFYSPIGAEGERYDEAEETLKTRRYKTGPLWDDLSLGKVMGGEDREMIAIFVAAQYLRSPSSIRAGAEMMGAIANKLAQVSASNKKWHDQTIDSYEADTGEKIPPEDREKMREFIGSSDNFTLGVLRDAGLPMLGAIGNLADIIYRMKWVVGRSKDQHLITSDCPVTRTSDPATHHPIYGDGAFANKTARVNFPLSPYEMLEMSWVGGERDRIVEIPKQMAREMNKNRAIHAERFAYSSEKDHGISKLCGKWLDEDRPQIATLGRTTPKIEVKRKL